MTRKTAWNSFAALAPLLILTLLLIRQQPPDVSFRIIQIFSLPLSIWAVGSILIDRFWKTRTAHGTQEKSEGLSGFYLAGWPGILIVILITLTAVSLVRSQFISHRSDDPRRMYLLTGDEPSYLLLSHSFVFDRDFNLFNNHRDSLFFDKHILLEPGSYGFDYYNTISKGRLAGQEKNWKNQQYFISRPAFPILLSPAYWIGFHFQHRIRFVVLVCLNVLTIVLAVVMLLLAGSIHGAPLTNIVAVLFLVLSAPLLYYSSQIYPDLSAALFIAGALLGLIKACRGRTVLITGFLIACLPWFHERYLGITLVLIIAALFRQPFRRHPIHFGVFIILSFIVQGWYYSFFYGVPYPLNNHKPLVLSAIPRGLMALLTDRDKGLFFLNPLLILVPVGIIPLWKKNAWLAGTLLALLVSYILPVAAFPDWHGGLCPPLRYLVPIIPLLVIPMTALLKGEGWPLTRTALYPLGLWALWMGIKVAGQPKLLFWEYGALFQDKAFHAAHGLFPGYFNPAPGSFYRSLLWLGFLVSFPAWDWLVWRKKRGGNSTPFPAWASLLLAGGLLLVSLISPLTE